MWTAQMGNEVIDLRKIDTGQRQRLHTDRRIPWACRGCGGRAHMRWNAGSDDRTRLDAYDDKRGPFITFSHHPFEAEKCRAVGYHSDESFEHHSLKDILARSAEGAGWTAEIEVPGDRCKADVLVTRNGASRVLEAQVSPLGVDEALRRHDLYTSEFGPTTWTHTRRRSWSVQLESLQVDDALEQVVGGVYEDQAGDVLAPPTPIAMILPRVLSGELRYVFVRAATADYGFFTPIGRTGTVTAGRRLREAMLRHGEQVEECARPLISGTISCVNCGFGTLAGRPCQNPICEAPSCTTCGRQPWHSAAVCDACQTERA